jgi:hypothetical protein
MTPTRDQINFFSDNSNTTPFKNYFFEKKRKFDLTTKKKQL